MNLESKVSLHSSPPSCWCGNEMLEAFSPDYLRCASCETLVARAMPDKDRSLVVDDSGDFYGKDYYITHLTQDYGLPDLASRARTDLPERCTHWLMALLKFKLPPSKILELGSAHGGFVALMNWAGYDATGLELSPWLVDFAKTTFGVELLNGPIERQRIESRSLDGIALMDVLEHLQEPKKTIECCTRLLKTDGVLLIQTPCYSEKKTFQAMESERDPFLFILKPNDHLYLFSMQSVKALLSELGLTYVSFEIAIFEQYDMFLVASRSPLKHLPYEEIFGALSAKSSGRIVQALLDLYTARADLNRKLREVETDRQARLEQIVVLTESMGKLSNRLQEIDEDREERLKLIRRLSDQMNNVEKDREERLKLIEKLSEELQVIEKDRKARLEVIKALSLETEGLSFEMERLKKILSNRWIRLLLRTGLIPEAR